MSAILQLYECICNCILEIKYVIQINLPSYDEKLNYIKEAERMNSSQITKSEMADVFELSEQQVNDIATAA